MELLDKIRAHHVFGVVFIGVALAILSRPVGGAASFARAWNTTPAVLAAAFFVCGVLTLLIVDRTHGVNRMYAIWLLSAPMALYLLYSIDGFIRDPNLPDVPPVIYSGVVVHLWLSAWQGRKRDVR